MRYLKIPVERVGVLIGHNGETKKHLEDVSNVKIDVDSHEGEVTIDEKNAKDPLLVLKIEVIIRAIGRGFSPQHAMKLFSDDFDFFVFDIYDYVGKKESHVKRLKSRVIGRGGKTKHVLEEITESNISIYGHTISVIADIENMDIIKKAVDMLLTGSRHSTVYRFVEGSMKKLRLERRLGF
ncbi:MAG: KH domain-containing protein [Candidatus Thermoplasmatota archaeon]|jgi:ribosomal RNA assembly protein|nr:KH domain-containing protein [Candidatus Thermoplasmatota archaeon]